MWRILKSLHFKYKKFNDGRHDIVTMRVTFLGTLVVNRRKNNDFRPVAYLDEM